MTFAPETPAVSSHPPTSSKRPSVAARALQSKPGKLTTQVITGLTLASGVVGVASTVAHAAGNPEAVTVITQLAQLIELFRRLFGG